MLRPEYDQSALFSLSAQFEIAIQEELNGKAVDWLEHVTDDQYGQ